MQTEILMQNARTTMLQQNKRASTLTRSINHRCQDRCKRLRGWTRRSRKKILMIKVSLLKKTHNQLFTRSLPQYKLEISLKCSNSNREFQMLTYLLSLTNNLDIFRIKIQVTMKVKLSLPMATKTYNHNPSPDLTSPLVSHFQMSLKNRLEIWMTMICPYLKVIIFFN